MRLRSLLFVPGDRPDQMQKALHADADALILDLEDSVAPAAKAKARGHITAFLQTCDRLPPVFVRINAPAFGCLEDDTALGDTPPYGWVLPKADGAASVDILAKHLEGLGLQSPRILPIAAETPAAIFRLGEYAVVANRLVGVTWGAEDLRTAVSAPLSREMDGQFTSPYQMVRALILFAAHAAGVPAIETVYPAFRDADGLKRYAIAAARDGFTGMMAIHPSQVALINEAFTPSAAALEHARRILAAFADNPQAGVLSVDGVMIDVPHLKLAQQMLA